MGFLESLGDPNDPKPDGVLFTAHTLPLAIRVTIASADRDTPHGTISRVLRLR